MTDREIRREIKRRIDDGKDGYAGNLKSMLDFIDACTVETESQWFDKEYDRYFAEHETDIVLNPYTNCKELARHFADWQKKQDFPTKDITDSTIYWDGYKTCKEELMKGAVECTCHEPEVDGIGISGVEILSDGMVLDDEKFKVGDIVEADTRHANLNAVERFTMQQCRVVFPLHGEVVYVVVSAHTTIEQVKAEGSRVDRCAKVCVIIIHEYRLEVDIVAEKGETPPEERTYARAPFRCHTQVKVLAGIKLELLKAA